MDYTDQQIMDHDYIMDRIDKQYFIDRKGRVHKYKGDMYAEVVSMHYEIAAALHPGMDYPDDHVMKMGWILMGSSVYHFPIIHRKPTQKQIDTLFDLDMFQYLTVKDGGHYIKYADSKWAD